MSAAAQPPTPGPAWVLAFDVSTPRCVIAVGRVDTSAGTQALVASDEQDDGNRASTHLMPRVEQVLGRAGIGPGDLAAVACGRGPGTFTGTRVAVASAKGLAHGLGRPGLGCSTLAAIAASVAGGGPVLAVVDARRGEVYGGLWRCSGVGAGEGAGEGTGAGAGEGAGAGAGEGAAGMPAIEAVGEEQVLELGALLERLRPWPAGLRVAGSGVAPHRAAIPAELAATALQLVGPSAAGLWAAAASAWARGRAVHPAALEAVYLRASYAEMGINKPKRPFVKSPFV